MQGHYRELTHMVENDLAQAIVQGGPLPEPGRKRVSRRVKSFPITPRVTLRPDEKAQRWLLGISASDRTGLLYLVARVLARHQLSVQLAKVSTLGERVEDTFLVQGPSCRTIFGRSRSRRSCCTRLLDAQGRQLGPVHTIFYQMVIIV
jgi:[protein-PII] uridylyltransferase